MFLLLLLLPLLLLLLLLLLLRMPLEWFPEVPSGCQRLPEASRDQRFPDWILIRKVFFWDWLAGEGCSLEASLSPDEKHIFIISMHFCGTVVFSLQASLPHWHFRRNMAYLWTAKFLHRQQFGALSTVSVFHGIWTYIVISLGMYTSSTLGIGFQRRSFSRQ